MKKLLSLLLLSSSSSLTMKVQTDVEKQEKIGVNLAQQLWQLLGDKNERKPNLKFQYALKIIKLGAGNKPLAAKISALVNPFDIMVSPETGAPPLAGS